MQNNTLSVTQTGQSYSKQEIIPDYTNIYISCGTTLILGLIGWFIIYKISEKWKIIYYQIEQLKVNKACEQNIVLLRKLDKVLDVLNKEVS